MSKTSRATLENLSDGKTSKLRLTLKGNKVIMTRDELLDLADDILGYLESPAELKTKTGRKRK